MPAWLAVVPIEQVRVLVPVYVVAALLLALLLLPVAGVRGPRGRRLAWTAVAAGVGAVVGWGLVWWIADLQDVFGAPASPVVRAGATAAGAGVGVALANLPRTAWWRRAVAVVAVPVVIAAGGVMINRDVAYFPRLGDVVGDTGVAGLVLDPDADAGRSLADWRPPADMPATGSVGTVRIPGTESHWHGRDAWVYLPPAARTAHPPKLPVVVAFSGQPGGPSDLFVAGGLQDPLDALAAQHRGIAPIVVVPDQLGAYNRNPMCIDSKVGNVATYVLVDVRDWIEQHLPVSHARSAWTVAGFSEGGTCAVQFGTEDPAVFGSLIAVAPELGPFNGTLHRTIEQGWNGDRAAYEAAQPIAVMRRHGRYRDTWAVYSVGADDKRYGKDAGILAAASRRAGMHVDYRLLDGLAHNWNTGAAGLRYGIAQLTPRWRLP